MASDAAPGGSLAVIDRNVGFLVGLKAEAALLRQFFPDAPIAISGATPEGARRGVDRLVASGASGLVSFGLAAGLDPALAPGSIIIPDAIAVDGRVVPCDPRLRRALGAKDGVTVGGALLHSDTVVLKAEDKQRLGLESGCCALDMESGFVAQRAREARLPFAALRAVCDSASRTLPPATAFALSPEGGVKIGMLLQSLAQNPAQIGGLIAIGLDAGRARKAMAHFLKINRPSVRFSR
ncbi:phosphorylase family protein [Acetobacter sacchari]|uniref:phosphorylase family protein n=1 Tax=Acetobacter sacchari TaxID=2661687 RepID=UPI001FAFE917|nr:hypothetical protein [Acetobacter sacchari]